MNNNSNFSDEDGVEPSSLSEKDFIHESRRPPTLGSFPLWLWLALLSFAIALLWGGASGLQNLVKKEVQASPLLEVTNRQFSLFLWQFPSFMRYFAKEKNSYLPGFQYVDKQTMNLSTTEDFVAAPPEILFLYHTWHRLLVNESITRPISPLEFVEFLNQVEEWQPKNWRRAPKSYTQLINSKSYGQVEDLQTLSEEVLPFAVRQAFLGWKNFYKEGDAINQQTYTYGQVLDFLKQYPHYARSFWRNIEQVENRTVAGNNYLQSLFSPTTVIPDDPFPNEQLAPFLKVALFNAQQAQKESSEFIPENDN
jgi:hypothetical protein